MSKRRLRARLQRAEMQCKAAQARAKAYDPDREAAWQREVDGLRRQNRELAALLDQLGYLKVIVRQMDGRYLQRYALQVAIDFHERMLYEAPRKEASRSGYYNALQDIRCTVEYMAEDVARQVRDKLYEHARTLTGGVV